MADECDIASEYQAKMIQHALHKFNPPVSTGVPVGEVYCEDCGEEIPRARVLSVPYTSRCTSCQRSFETGAK